MQASPEAGGSQLTTRHAWAIAHPANEVGRDVVYLNFDRKRPEPGPNDFTILAIHDGVLHQYAGCRLWAPADGGPALLLTRGKGCFSFDGVALVPHEERPVAAVGEGVARPVVPFQK